MTLSDMKNFYGNYNQKREELKMKRLEQKMDNDKRKVIGAMKELATALEGKNNG